MTLLSLSEVESIAIKAARGAGLDWGLAEEAAFATRWLVEQGLDGPALLAVHLDRLSASPRRAQAILIREGLWQSPDSEPLCPIAFGAALGDHFDLPDGPMARKITLARVATPALVLPFLAQAAARSRVVVVVEWAATRVLLSDLSLLAVTGAEGLTDTTASVMLTALPKWPTADQGQPRADVSAATADILNRLVFRTYVPASDQSRRDAGAAGTDNL